MAETECACANFERLEGSAVRIYIALYLEETGVDEKSLFTKFWIGESKTTRNVLARIPEASD